MRRVLAGLLFGILLVCVVPAFAWREVTVSKSETLGSIAEKYRPHAVTEMDMVIAIRNSNPMLAHAGLKPGMKLHVPTTVGEVRQAITGKRQTAAQLKADKGVPSDMLPVSVKQKAVLKKEKQALKQQKSVQKKIKQKPESAVAKTAVTPLAPKPATALAPTPTPVSAPTPAAVTPVQSQPVINSAALSTTPETSAWSWQNLWFVLFVLTLILYLRARRRIKKLGQAEPFSVDETAPKDPNFLHSTEEDTEPTLVADAGEPADADPEWHQVELDIPASDAPTQTHMQLSPSLTLEEEKELDGEQQDIINALSNDHDNLEWHRALLEFYVKTNNQNGFNRHFQNMLKTRLMTEGDTLWEEVRKMYLNHWIYRGERVDAVS